jgi:hypothetical protein
VGRLLLNLLRCNRLAVRGLSEEQIEAVEIKLTHYQRVLGHTETLASKMRYLGVQRTEVLQAQIARMDADSSRGRN